MSAQVPRRRKASCIINAKIQYKIQSLCVGISVSSTLMGVGLRFRGSVLSAVFSAGHCLVFLLCGILNREHGCVVSDS